MLSHRSTGSRPGWRALAVLCFAFLLTAGCIVVDSTDEETAGDSAVETDSQDERASTGDAEPASEVAEAEAEDDRGFFDRVFDRGPQEVTVPAGTLVAVRFLDAASSHDSAVGQAVTAEVVDDVAAGGEVAIPAGSTVIGRVTEAHRPGIGGQARLAIDFVSVELPSGESAPLVASVSAVGKSEKGKDVATIVGGTAAGAILGHQIENDDEGKVVGGIVGGGIGTAIAKGTQGKPVVIPAGTVVDVALETAVTVPVAS